MQQVATDVLTHDIGPRVSPEQARKFRRIAVSALLLPSTVRHLHLRRNPAHRAMDEAQYSVRPFRDNDYETRIRLAKRLEPDRTFTAK